MSHRLSLSKYGLALQCSYGFRADVQVPDRPVGKAARVGTLVHRMAELRAKGLDVDGDPMFLEADPHELAEAAGIYQGPLSGYVDDWRASPATTRWSELRLRYDAATDSVREVPRRDQSGYTRPGATEATGEIDFAAVYDDGSADVEDLKTGSPRHVDEAQAVAYGVLISRYVPGLTRVRVRYVYARKTKLTTTDWVEMDVDTLDAEAGRIGKVLRMLPTAQATPPKDESICQYRCPLGRASCPAWVSRQAEDLEQAGYFG